MERGYQSEANVEEDIGARSLSKKVTGRAGGFPQVLTDGRGFTLIELLVVVVIIGVLAAIAIPTYVGQQDEAKDTAAQAQLRTAATAQQLFYAQEDSYATNATQLADYGFRQGDQAVTVRSGDTSSYCMDAPGGDSNVFRMTEELGKPESDGCTGP